MVRCLWQKLALFASKSDRCPWLLKIAVMKTIEIVMLSEHSNLFEYNMGGQKLITNEVVSRPRNDSVPQKVAKASQPKNVEWYGRWMTLPFKSFSGIIHHLQIVSNASQWPPGKSMGSCFNDAQRDALGNNSGGSGELCRSHLGLHLDGGCRWGNEPWLGF